MGSAEEYFRWRDREHVKRRVMTAAEYGAWCKAGDALSSPSESNPFPGGLFISFGPDDGVLGYTDREPSGC